MFKKLKTIKKLLTLPEEDLEQLVHINNTTKPAAPLSEGDGNAVFLSYMDEEEAAEYIKNDVQGWGKIVKKIKELTNGK